MELNKVIKGRRSIRNYVDRPIEKEKIEKIIEAGTMAPSACDIQGWRFIVINNKKLKEKIVNAGGAHFIKNAPVGILVLYDNRTDNVEYMDYIQGASAAIQNMLLTAHSLGLGSCWVCHLPTKKQLRSLLKIPWYYDPIAYITIGYHKKEPRSRPRRHETNKLTAYNIFDFDEKTPSKIYLKSRIKRILRGIYLRLPTPIKKILKPLERKVEVKFE